MKTKALFILCCFLISACSLVSIQPDDMAVPTAPKVQPTMSTLPNPASAFCEQRDFTLEIRSASDGSQSGFCIFPDGSACEEWAYYRGECAPASEGSSMHNPASAFCEEQGYTLEIHTAEDGSQAGFCLFPDGSACDEWAFYRGTCQPGDKVPTESTDGEVLGWEVYTNQTLGYSFQYPMGVDISINDNPLKSLYISGSGMGNESWTISHPSDRDEYRPPENVDLLQWLTDHYLVGELQLPDEQIGGTIALHFRHERSPQSYAADFYYFANAGQLYQIIIGHSGDVEDSTLNNHFLQSFTFFQPAANNATEPLPTAISVNPAAYQDWITYTHPVYNFRLRLPADWIVEEVSNGGPGMDGHLLSLHPADQYSQESIRLTFRRPGEDVLLWPTGVGQGEFIPQGTLNIDGQAAQRMLLVCPTGEITAIWYYQGQDQPNLLRGGLEFGFLYSASPVHCAAGHSLSGEVQLLGEMIVASLHVF